METGTGMVVPDYERPAAIMVPHYDCDLTSTLEQIARRLGRHTGVILLSSDPELTEAFVNTLPNRDHYTLITAPLDTPWIRDRSPIAIREGNDIRWCLPTMETEDRPNDEALFKRICADQHPLVPVRFLPHGNLVTGADGLAFVTTDVLADNGFRQSDLAAHNVELGIRRWIVFDGFEQEQTGHADIHVRVLGEKLFAVAWNRDSEVDRKTTEALEKQILAAVPGADILRIPIRSENEHYASLVNWIQVGKHLLVPRYDLTTAEDIRETRELLSEQGFEPEFIHSPTLEIYGSLHCLTASVYVNLNDL